MTREQLARIALGLNLAGLFALGLWFRAVDLADLPGINADEAWYGVQAWRCRTGQSFAMLTPTGLPLNPFLVGPEAVLLLGLEPSFWVLRIPAAVSGVLAIGLAYALGARVLGRPTALAAAVLMACLPIAIAYARFGWDASQSPLFGLLALYYAFRGRPIGLSLAFSIGLVVHPTNVFLLPTLLAIYLSVAFRRAGGDRRVMRRLLILALLGSLATAAVVARLPAPAATKLAPWSPFEIHGWLRTVAHVARLLSGVSIYQFVVDEITERAAKVYILIFWAIVGPTFALGAARLIRERRWDQVALSIGLALSVVTLHLTAGPDAIRPHYERYGMFLVAPAVFAFACQWQALFSLGSPAPSPARPRAALWAASILGWAFLVDFHHQYFDPLRTTGGASHRAFRTAAVEPKQQAYRIIDRDLGPVLPGTPRLIVAEDWWLHWPLQFLASPRPDVEVTRFELLGEDPEECRLRFLEAIRSGAHAVGFAGGKIEQVLASLPPDEAIRRQTIRDVAGAPFLDVWRRNDPGPGATRPR